MIANERQYRITNAAAREFEEALARLETVEAHRQPDGARAQCPRIGHRRRSAVWPPRGERAHPREAQTIAGFESREVRCHVGNVDRARVWCRLRRTDPEDLLAGADVDRRAERGEHDGFAAGVTQGARRPPAEAADPHAWILSQRV